MCWTRLFKEQQKEILFGYEEMRGNIGVSVTQKLPNESETLKKKHYNVIFQ